MKDLLRQSAIMFFVCVFFLWLFFFFCYFYFFFSKFCSCWTFDIHIPFKSSAGLVIVRRFDVVSFTFFSSFLCSSKSFCGPEKVAVIQAGFCGERSVYMCAEEEKKVLGLTRLVQIHSEFQSFSTSKKEVSLTRSSLSLSLLCFLKQPQWSRCWVCTQWWVANNQQLNKTCLSLSSTAAPAARVAVAGWGAG